MRVKNFAKFQHFKDRSPPWVKLYRDILDDPDWHELDAEAAKVLVMLWLIASEDESKQGKLPELKKLSFRLRIEQKRLEKLCINLSHWLEHDDINVISDVYQLDAPERETERETEKKPRNARFDFVGAIIESGVDASVANDYITVRKAKKCVQTETAFKSLTNEVEKSGLSFSEAISLCCKKGWGGFEASWIKPEDRPATAAVYAMPEFMRGAR